MKSLATGNAPGKLYLDSIEKLRLPGLKEPVHHLREVLGLNNDGIPANKDSRMKFYVTDQMVTWDRVADMWTLRGRRLEDPQCGNGLTLLRKLWDLLMVPKDHRGNVWPDLAFGTPPSPDYRAVMMANWTLSPTKKFPDPQIYFLTFGMSDTVVMDALITFYEMVDWMDLARTYRDKVTSYYNEQEKAHTVDSPELDLTKTNYVHSGISFSYRNSKPYVSVYYSPF
ncbi:unnamed protein product [Penicillium viridicatum]